MYYYIRSSLYKEPQDYSGMFGVLLFDEASSKTQALVYDTKRKAENGMRRIESKPTRDNVANEVWTNKAFDYIDKVSESDVDGNKFYPDDSGVFITLLNETPIPIRRR